MFGKNKKTKATTRKKGTFKMLNFGVAYFDDDGDRPKSRILLKSDDAKVPPCVQDDNRNVLETYTREEAAYLVGQALALGRGISIYWFENNDGTISGNARIDINGLSVDSEGEEDEPKPKSKAAAKRRYDEEADDTDDDGEELTY